MGSNIEQTSLGQARLGQTSLEQTRLEEKIDLILEELSLIKNCQSLTDEPYESNETSELNSALALANLEFPIIKINRQNPYLASGYSDMDEIMVKIRPVLGKHGLHLAQGKKLIDGVPILHTRVWHSSGQWIESRVLVSPTKNTIESYGSNLSSMKRFEVMDILGLTVSEDPFDDDGEADMTRANELAEGGANLKSLYDTSGYSKKEESYAVISNVQYSELMKELDAEEAITEEILSGLHIRSFRELPASRFLPTINRIRKIKKINQGL